LVRIVCRRLCLTRDAAIGRYGVIGIAVAPPDKDFRSVGPEVTHAQFPIRQSLPTDRDDAVGVKPFNKTVIIIACHDLPPELDYSTRGIFRHARARMPCAGIIELLKRPV
jgi:hypothetical protein